MQMKSKVLLYNICILIGFLAVKCVSVNSILNEFQKYIVRYGKNYSENSYEFQRRLHIFTDHFKEYHQLNMLNNRSNFAAKYSITKFSDLTPEEFKDLYLSDLISSVKPSNISRIIPVEKLRQLNIPFKLDWRSNRNFSVVTPVKNQLKCGGCWAFSTVETVESMAAIASNAAVTSLSVQQVIDCSYNNLGCQGGDTCQALRWMVSTKTPIVSETLYPLTDESNPCKIEPNSTKGILVKAYECYSHIAEDHLLSLLQNGPVAAAVDATTWNNYQGGIIQYHCDIYTNHAVQIVGYDITGEVPYYIVRNSWGSDFGHDGYLYIKIGANVCGITTEIATVLV